MSDDNPDWTQRVDIPLKFTVMSDTPGGYGDAGQALVVNDTETGVGYSGAKVDDHSARHEDNGADPIFNLGGNVSFPDRSYFLVATSSDFNINAGDSVVLPLDTILFDNRNEFDTTNYKFVPEKNGFYCLIISAFYGGTNDQDRIHVRIYLNNSSLISEGHALISGWRGETVKTMICYYFNALDEITIEVQNDVSDDVVKKGAHTTYFSGFLIA